MIAGIASVAGLVLFLALCPPAIHAAEPPDDSLVEFLTEDLWQATVGSESVVFEITFRDGVFGGRLHRVIDGRQHAELAVTQIVLDGSSIEIQIAPYPSFRGGIDRAGGRIEGGMPGAGPYAAMDLHRVGRADWPMIEILRDEGQGRYRWKRPEELADGWATGDLDEAVLNQSAVESLVTAIADGQAGAMHSLLIARGGKLVVEQYFHGWRPDDLHRVASVTKSVSSLLVGVAIDRGLLEGVDAPLLGSFPERRPLAGRGWSSLRLEHLLTMSMGLDWSDSEAESYAPAGEDWFTSVLSRNVEREPGTRWRYVSRNTQLLSGILHRAAGVHADVFAAEYLFAPLGIAEWDWGGGRFGEYPSMSGTLKLRPRDMAKLGQLVLNDGRWAGRQLLSPEWIRQSTSGHIPCSPGEQYGYLWRLLDEPQPGGTVLASGIGSQFIAVIPSLDLVLVTTGANEFNGLHPAFLGVAREHLLPGVGPAS